MSEKTYEASEWYDQKFDDTYARQQIEKRRIDVAFRLIEEGKYDGLMMGSGICVGFRVGGSWFHILESVNTAVALSDGAVDLVADGSDLSCNLFGCDSLFALGTQKHHLIAYGHTL